MKRFQNDNAIIVAALGNQKKKGFLGWKNEISFLVFIV